MLDCSVFVGLDVHRDSVQVCVMDRSGVVQVNRSVANQVERIVEKVGAGVVVHAAMEACTGAAELAERLIEDHGWSVSLAHPAYVHRLKQSPDKTDFSDAQLLADLTRVGYLPRVWLAPAKVRELRRLVRLRQAAVNDRRATKQRINGWLRELRINDEPAGTRWTKAWRAWARHHGRLSDNDRWLMDEAFETLDVQEQRVRRLERRLEEVVAEDAITQRLLSMPGIGLVTACWLRAEVGRFDRFATGKQLARFCGLSPRNDSTGPRQADAGLIRAASAPLRTVLIEAAWRLVRHSPRWAAMAAKMKRRGKAGGVIAAAVANRWVRTLHHAMQTPAAA